MGVTLHPSKQQKLFAAKSKKRKTFPNVYLSKWQKS
jgi:hypothetical protein